MNRTALGCAVAGVIAVVLALLLWVPYNRLVGMEENVGAQWAQVESQYQRRADLIPNLVSTVQGAAGFEQDTLLAVTEARSKATQLNVGGGVPTAEELAEFDATQGELTQALSRLLVVVEAYPQLTATQNFRDLQAQLEGTENRIAVERQRYNEVALSYETTRRRFPTVLIAGLLGFDEIAYFSAQPGAETAPPVDFSNAG